MQRISEIVCWGAVGVLLIYGILVVLLRGFGITIALFHLFADSMLPWWVLGPATVALALGFAYLLRGLRVRQSRKH
jgi:hypothetical protein